VHTEAGKSLESIGSADVSLEKKGLYHIQIDLSNKFVARTKIQ